MFNIHDVGTLPILCNVIYNGVVTRPTCVIISNKGLMRVINPLLGRVLIMCHNGNVFYVKKINVVALTKSKVLWGSRDLELINPIEIDSLVKEMGAIRTLSNSENECVVLYRTPHTQVTICKLH